MHVLSERTARLSLCSNFAETIKSLFSVLFNVFWVAFICLLLNVSSQPGKDSAGLLSLMGRNMEETARE